MYLIDTNVAIHLRDKDRDVVLRMMELAVLPALSIISLVELESGAAGSSAVSQVRRTRLEALVGQLTVIEFDQDIVTAYGAIVAAAGYSRRKVFDRLIAATAIVHDLTLVTINAEDFRDIPGLRIEGWPAPQ